MPATLNLHQLLSDDRGYLRELKVPDDERDMLTAARTKLRNAIRAAFKDPERYLSKAELYGSRLAEQADVRPLVAPRFRLQGSFAYATVNDCQVTPPQQIDQDDGVFLPVSFVTNDGARRPRLTSTAYFSLVEKAIAPLCEAEGWALNPGGQKHTCVRVGISPRLHIDLPLYAIKDEEYEMLAEAASVSRADSVRAMDARAVEEELSEDIYEALDSTHMALAHREDGWVPSDPRKLETWFRNAISVHGPIVRRLSRAFKGLRDAHWSECKLGSLCIMAAVVQAIERVGPLESSRDDLAALKVGREMVQIFGSPIENPVITGNEAVHLCKDWSDEFRAEVQQVFARACDELDAAIFNTVHKGLAVQRAQAAFGPRVPTDESLVLLVGVAETIRKIEPRPQPRPMVPRTESG